jgi:hypothetical protein
LYDDVNTNDSDDGDHDHHYTIECDPLTCPWCGSSFQSTDINDVGYLPPAKMENEIEKERIRCNGDKDDEEWSAAQEVDYLR